MPDMKTRYKKTVSVSLKPILSTQARAADDNLSFLQTQAINIARVDRWKMQNRASLQELNRIIEEHGLISDENRAF